MKYTIIVIVIGLFFVTSTWSQSSGQVESQIEALLLSYPNGRYELAEKIFGIDSISQTQRYNFEKVRDPYGTLKGCYLFIAQTGKEYHEKYSIGIFKNNSILWMSDSLYGEYSFGDFEAIFDINSDGYVEIVTSWKQSANNTDSDMWIFSWDGTRGWIINDVDNEGRTTMNSFCILKDVNGDGIYELVTERPVYNQQGVQISMKESPFIWNGSKYIPGSDVSEKKTTVANNLTASLNVNVTKHVDILEYRYALSNNSISVQSIKYLFIRDLINSAFV